MKYAQVYTLFLVFVFHTSCGQNKTEPHNDNINYSIKDTVTSYGPNRLVRNVKKGSNGTILFTASGVFRYDGKLFSNITSKIGARRWWDVLEDRRGNLWFASSDSGVYHYNGKTFQHFTTREGLSDNNLTTIMEDKTGKLWFGTRGELCFYDGKTFTVLKDKDGKAFKNVWSIIEDKKGNIWFGENGGRASGLWRYDGSTFTNVSQRAVYAIIEDKKGNIWTTGAVTLNVWVVSRYDQKSLYNKKPTVFDIMSGPPGFFGLLETTDGSIWFGASDGVYRYDGKTIMDFKSKKGQQ